MYGFSEPLKNPKRNRFLRRSKSPAKTSGPLKATKIFTLFLEAQKTPKLILLRVNSPRLRRPVKLNRGKEEEEEEEEETTTFTKLAENF